jgi:hypothetical protein
MQRRDRLRARRRNRRGHSDLAGEIERLKLIAYELIGPTQFERVGRSSRTLLLYRSTESGRPFAIASAGWHLGLNGRLPASANLRIST